MNKKRILRGFCMACLIALGIGANSSASAQLWVGFGPQVGYFNMENANAPVDFFNSKGFLFRPQRKLRWPWGLHYAASYRKDGLFLELAFNSKGARGAFETAEANGIQRRETKFTIHALSAGVGYAIVDQPDLQWYLVGNLDLGYMRLLSRSGLETNINRANYFTYRRTSFVGVTFSSRFVFRSDEEALSSWSLGPYVQIPFQEFEFREFNTLLNPLDWEQVGRELPARPINFGVLLTFDLDLLGILE